MTKRIIYEEGQTWRSGQFVDGNGLSRFVQPEGVLVLLDDAAHAPGFAGVAVLLGRLLHAAILVQPLSQGFQRAGRGRGQLFADCDIR